MLFLCVHFLLSVFVLSGLLGQDRDDCFHCQDEDHQDGVLVYHLHGQGQVFGQEENDS